MPSGIRNIVATPEKEVIGKIERTTATASNFRLLMPFSSHLIPVLYSTGIRCESPAKGRQGGS